MVLSNAEIALVGQAITAIGAYAAYVKSAQNNAKIQEIHLSINSRMDQLLAAQAQSAHAAGREEGLAAGITGAGATPLSASGPVVVTGSPVQISMPAGTPEPKAPPEAVEE